METGIDADASQTDGPIIGDAASDPAYSWLFENAAWQSLVNVPGCDVREADLKKVKWPGHVWKPCGTGCRTANVFAGPPLLFNGAYVHGTGGRAAGTDAEVFMVAGGRFPPAVHLAKAFSLATDLPSSLVAVHGDECVMAFAGATSSRMFEVFRIDAGPDKWLGIAPSDATGKVVWPKPSVKSDILPFDLTTGWGWLLAQAKVEVTFDGTSTQLQTVHSATAPQLNPRSSGNAVVWTDWAGGQSVIRVWTPNGGPRVLVQGPWNAVNPEITEKRLAWISSTSPSTMDGSYANATLHWAKRQLDPDALGEENSMSLPISVSPLRLVGHGRWAALRQTSKAGQSAILVADLDAPALWRIPEAPGRHATVVAVSDAELLVADGSTAIQPGQVFDSLLRYDLAQLSAYATKLQ